MGRRLFLVDEMGHAFDPAGAETVCRAVEWVTDPARSPVLA